MSNPGLPRPRLSDPVQFLAFGFGSGLAPRAPGTFGTLASLPLYLLVAGLPLWAYTLFVLIGAAVGIWLCGKASDRLGVHDHPGIVWDEFVGMWITLWALPVEPVWIIAGFVAFRFFDVLKPWPIGWLDRSTAGGFGIMIDDVVAGIMACALLHGILRLVAGLGVLP